MCMTATWGGACRSSVQRLRGETAGGQRARLTSWGGGRTGHRRSSSLRDGGVSSGHFETLARRRAFKTCLNYPDFYSNRSLVFLASSRRHLGGMERVYSLVPLTRWAGCRAGARLCLQVMPRGAGGRKVGLDASPETFL